MQTNKRHNLSATLPLHAALSRPSNKVPATKVLTASLPFICQRSGHWLKMLTCALCGIQTAC